jgi:hypothetical protein
MRTESTLEETTITHSRSLAEGVAVHITGVPAEILHRVNGDDLTLFKPGISTRLRQLKAIARARAANGETEIALDFTTGA